jgi:hypothetical protein
MKQVVLLSEIAAETLTIACGKCGRNRTFRVADAIRLRGDIGLPEVLSRATRDCPRWGAWRDPCAAVFAEIRGEPRGRHNTAPDRGNGGEAHGDNRVTWAARNDCAAF